MSGSTRWRGIAAGLSAALLFGVSAPAAKLLLPNIPPLPLAALLYLGGGIALLVFSGLKRSAKGAASSEAPLSRADVPSMVGVIVCGGVIGPVLMLWGLQRLTGVAGALLLNLEGPFTVLLALGLFGEHLGWRGALSAVLIFAGAGVLSLAPGTVAGDGLGALALGGACLSWAVDNNLTQRLSNKDPVAVVRTKALGAGSCMAVLAVLAGHPLPEWRLLLAATALGGASYGASILLDVYALRWLGAAREAALFASAPFLGAVAAVPLLGERLRVLDGVAGALMLTGVVLLVRERHAHLHTHDELEHEHLHHHDAHHQHDHSGPVIEPHSHPHRHAALTHDHPHVSDAHHRHRH